MEEVGIKSAQTRRQMKCSWVGKRLTAQGEARKQAHEAGAQAVSGAKGQGRRIAAGFELPDMIVDVIGAAQAEIRCQVECLRVTGTEIPIAHAYSIRSFWPKVKGFVLEYLSERRWYSPQRPRGENIRFMRNYDQS